MARPKHPSKEFEDVLRSAEKQGWRIERGRKYFKMKCSCPNRDMKTMHITPNEGYLKNFCKKLERDTCWKDDR